ncbi:MAG: hypothetical protein GX339_04060 [Tissierellia bacterium]|nr:hypothetical protein [Tissierellia bacterium]
MKKRIMAISFALMLALSSRTAFAVERINYTNFNFFDFFNNYNYEPANTDSQTNTYSHEATVNNRAQTYTEEVETSRATAPTSSNLNYEQKVAELVNIERQKVGLAPLTLDSAISNVARAKSKDMSDNNYFAHQSPTYGSAGNMLTQFGVKWSAWGENIAAGQSTPEAVVRAWMNSESHKANILSPNFSKIGVGYVNSGRPYWTQMFTN